jgi:hypothetical protein
VTALTPGLPTAKIFKAAGDVTALTPGLPTAKRLG